MESFVIFIHVIIAIVIIGLILLQQGKGAETGATFGGGASQTVFGGQGSGNFFSKLTGVLAFIFFATSFSLAIIAKNKSIVTSTESGIPTLEQVQPEESEVPSTSIDVEDPISGEVPVVTSQNQETAEPLSEELPVVTSQNQDTPEPELNAEETPTVDQ